MFSRKLIGAAAGIALALSSSSVFAALAASNAFVNGTNELSDDSGEVLLNLGAGGEIQIGTQFVGVIGITSFPTSLVPVDSVNELTAIFALEVTDILAGPFPCGVGGAQCLSVTYGAVADFNASVAALGLGLGPFFQLDGVTPVGAGTVALLYEDPAQDFVRSTGTLADSFASALGGIHRMTMVEGSEFFGITVANAADVGLFGRGSNLGSFGGDLLILEENFGTLDFDPVVQVSGSQSRPTLNSPYDGIGVHNDATFTLQVQLVPEPALVSMIGLGFLALGAIGAVRRRGRSA